MINYVSIGDMFGADISRARAYLFQIKTLQEIGKFVFFVRLKWGRERSQFDPFPPFGNKRKFMIKGTDAAIQLLVRYLF